MKYKVRDKEMLVRSFDESSAFTPDEQLTETIIEHEVTDIVMTLGPFHELLKRIGAIEVHRGRARYPYFMFYGCIVVATDRKTFEEEWNKEEKTEAEVDQDLQFPEYNG